MELPGKLSENNKGAYDSASRLREIAGQVYTGMMIFSTKKAVGAVLLSATALIVYPYSIFSSPGFDVRGEKTINEWSRYSAVEIAMERTRFQADEDIEVRFRIKNNGYRIFRIFPSTGDNRSFELMVLKRNGGEVSKRINTAEMEKRRENGERHLITLTGEDVKELNLHPGEVYERRIFLNDYYNLEPGQEYRVAGYFYPDARNDFFVRSKNTIPIRIDPRPSGGYTEIETENPAVETGRPSITPEETVYLFLSAEMQGNWKNYLKYLELEKYISVYDRFASRYAKAEAEERAVILRSFRKYLTGRPSDRLVRFKILDSTPERGPDGELLDDSRVTVRATGTRESNGYSVRYEYSYILENTGPAIPGFWKIVHVDAKVLE